MSTIDIQPDQYGFNDTWFSNIEQKKAFTSKSVKVDQPILEFLGSDRN